jgi:hypothetical protein
VEGAAWEGEGVGGREGRGSVFDFVIDGIDGAFYLLVFLNFSPFIFSFLFPFVVSFLLCPHGCWFVTPPRFPSTPLCWFVVQDFTV